MIGISLCGVAHARVDGSGAFATEVTIDVPSFPGLTPSIRLAYSSRLGPGLAGVGWRLDAASLITRTSATHGIARYDAGDLFSLDGLELIPCASGSTSPSCTTATTAFGSAANFFSTRVETYRRIKREPTTDTWTVWQPDGSRGEYASGDAGASYQLRAQIDTFGNRVDYAWACAASTGCTLDRIRYGARGIGAGTEIRFYREARPDPWLDHDGRTSVFHGERLRSIVVFNDGQLLRAYRLIYATSLETRGSLLASVQQFGRDASVDAYGAVTAGLTPPLPQVTFLGASQGASGAWTLDTEIAAPDLNVRPALMTPIAPRYGGSYLTADAQWVLLGGEPVVMPNGHIAGDFDGDGRAEIATWAMRDECRTISIRAFPTDANWTRPSVTTRIEGGARVGLTCAARFVVADVNGDGAEDIVATVASELRVLIADGDGGFRAGAFTPWSDKTGQCVAGDVDGDGRDDLVCEDGTAHVIKTLRSSPAGWVTSTMPTASLGPDHKFRMISGDVDGDGLADLLLARRIEGTSTTELRLGRSLGTGDYDWSEVNTVATWGDLATADVDGDGKLDLVFHRAQLGQPTVVDVIVARKGALASRWLALPSQTTSLTTIALADVNGDGRADMVGDDRSTTAPQIKVQYATSNGWFGALEASRGGCDERAMFEIFAADWNGDGLADPTCVSTVDDDAYAVYEHPGQPIGADRQRWLRADVVGDGQTELVYVAYTNPGYVVHVLSRATGQRTTFTLDTAGRVGLVEPDASRWMVADVGSSEGPADGKADLVLVEQLGGNLVTTTLLSNGNGSFVPVQRGVAVSADWSTLGWQPATLGRDGRAGFMRIVPSTSSGAAGITVETLRATGPGTYAFRSTPHFGPGSANPLVERAARGFRMADLDNDGLTDLVHIDAVPGASTIVRTLRADGAGDFVEVVTTNLPSVIGPRAWRVGDLDGDGAVDLFHIARTAAVAPCATVTHLAGNSRGGFATGNFGGVTCLSSSNPLFGRLFEDSIGMVDIDLDHDGRPELVHVSHASDATGARHLLFTRLRRDLSGPLPSWRIDVRDQPLAGDLGDAWSWAPHRDPVSGDLGLAYLIPTGSMLMRWRSVSDEVTSVDNGRGLRSTISYGPFVGPPGYLPAGFIPRVVSQIQTVDRGADPVTTDTVWYGFDGPRWSNASRGLIGFASTREFDGLKLVTTYQSLDDACGAQTTQSEVRDPDTRLFSYSVTQYVAPGATAPFRCQINTATAYACEGSPTCVAASTRLLGYDAYGNTEQVEVRADQAKTTIDYTSFNPSAGPYIVNRPMYRSRFDWKGDGWKWLSFDRWSYDGLASYQAPTKGAVTASEVWDEQTGAVFTTRYAYDASGNPTSVVSPEGRTRTTTYDPVYGRFPITQCAGTLCASQTWDFTLDRVTDATDAAGLTTSTTYDAHGRAITVVQPGNVVTRTSYLSAGQYTGAIAARQRVRTELVDGSPGDGVLWTEEVYDGSGRVLRTAAEGRGAVTRQYGDGSGRPTAISQPHDPALAPSRWTTFQYDFVGRIMNTRLPGGAFLATGFTVGLRADIDELGNWTTTYLDGNGSPVRVVDALGTTTRYTYDGLGRLTQITDALGNVNTMTWGTSGRQIATSDPDRGQRSYRYSPDGQLTGMTDARGNRIEWRYDQLGRFSTRTDHDAAGAIDRTIAATYDDGAAPHGASRGRLIRVHDTQANAVLDTEQWYDAAGRIEKQRQCIDQVCMETGSRFDVAGRVAALLYPDATGSITAPGAEQVTHQYDTAGRLRQLGSYATFAYATDDQLQAIYAGNGVTTTFDLDPDRRWLDRMTIGTATVQHARIDYTHDPAGRVTRQLATGQLTTDATYRYDALGRLTEVISPNAWQSELWTYDAIGRITFASSQGGARHYDDPAHVHAATYTEYGTVMSYDANGNTTSIAYDGQMTVNWTADNHVASLTTPSSGSGDEHFYAYDQSGRQVKDAAWSTERFFGSLVEVDRFGQLVKTYQAGGHVIARRRGAVLTYLHDDLGHNMRLATDDHGAVVQITEYRAFGEILRTSGYRDDLLFNSARQDDTTLVAMGARLYNPALAQFMSPDNVIPSPYRPQSLNRYAYVENDPINHWDPSGHMKASVEARKLRLEEAPYVPSEEEVFGGDWWKGSAVVEFDHGGGLEWGHRKDIGLVLLVRETGPFGVLMHAEMRKRQQAALAKAAEQARREGGEGTRQAAPSSSSDTASADGDPKPEVAVQRTEVAADQTSAAAPATCQCACEKVVQTADDTETRPDPTLATNQAVVDWFADGGGLLLALIEKYGSERKNLLATRVGAAGIGFGAGVYIGTKIVQGQDWLYKNSDPSTTLGRLGRWIASRGSYRGISDAEYTAYHNLTQGISNRWFEAGQHSSSPWTSRSSLSKLDWR